MSDPRCVLLVEGVNDAHAIRQVFFERGINGADEAGWKIGVKPAGSALQNGFPKLLQAIKDLVPTVALGFVFDADAEPRDRWRSMRARLAKQGVELEEALPAEGALGVSGRGVHAGCWMMPDNAAKGAVEDFLLGMVPKQEKLMRHAEAATEEARSRHEAAYRDPEDVGKARLQSFLAWQREPNALYGISVKRGLIDSKAASADAFAAWAKRLLVASGG